ncbi:MAG: dihydrolipoyl dehydrogenase [Halieaceae bacterium]|nr:dihydrolipoyl dehydrogenase [Halieaceae bacterium]MCP5165111.1 dihydrolipoyl dehydrogenase [Pseudomonadales bacterium]MCP5202710.1 dihydrolipoyl dehydrogenase [Pseudomonadales bacterium]
MSTSFDVIVVGGGPGGYVAAIRAAQLGLSTALVEKQHLGGICLNWGCIPTKALLQGAEVAHTLAHAADFGFTTGEVNFDLKRLVKHSRDVSARLAGGIGYLMNKNGITVVDGHARLSGKCRLAVQAAEKTLEYRADHIVLATGARPKPLPGIEPDGDRIWTYFEAMVPEALPRSLLVIGSGAIGVEFSSLYNDLGVDVTLVEVLDQLLPVEDKEVSAFARQQFERRGIKVHTSTRVTAIEKHADSVTCHLEGADGSTVAVTVERVILAAGIQGNVENIGLEEVGVETDRGFIVTDPWCRTNVAGLYAIGDVAGPPCLAHKASHEGVICIEKLAGVADVHPLDKGRVPGCTYCRPQVASVGMTEAQARAAGRPVNLGRFDLQANGRALAIGETAGFVKTVFDARSGELLGAHMIGPEVTEQIQGFGLAQSLEATEQDLARAVFAHPTLSEAMHESVLAALGRALHQ